MSEHNVCFEQLLPLIRERIAAGESVRFPPRGTSMLPMIRQGVDNVVLSPLPKKLKKYDIPFYRRKDGQFVLHRIVKTGETYTCIGDNQFQLEPGVEYGQMIGVVTAFTRGDREHSVHEPGYWLYCRFWHYSRPLRRLWGSIAWRLRRIIQ